MWLTMPPRQPQPGRAWPAVGTCLLAALLALAITAGTAVYIGFEVQCQHRLNQAAADESAATAALIDAIFIADQFADQLAAYTRYLNTMRVINQRRAAQCGY